MLGVLVVKAIGCVVAVDLDSVLSCLNGDPGDYTSSHLDYNDPYGILGTTLLDRRRDDDNLPRSDDTHDSINAQCHPTAKPKRRKRKQIHDMQVQTALMGCIR